MAGLSVGPWNARANPEGGAVVAGSAAMATSGNTLTVNNSNGAIINWQSFSIASQETTKFIQPSASSAVLNRVVGTDLSAIYGTLSSNGRVFLINPNGILVGAGGMINTAGFVGSTLNIHNRDFEEGKLKFKGKSGGSVTNLGTIQAQSGDVLLIAKQIDNQGTILANQGKAGLYASDKVYLATGQDGEASVRVSGTSFTNGTGIANEGLIQAAQAELKATGNMYSLAINNTGAIRATGTGVHNGVVRLIAMGGTTRTTGAITAQNADGKGGQIETSGEKVDLRGTIQTGKGGAWLIDPLSIDGSDISVATLEGQLDSGNITETATTSITLDETLSWTGTSVLTLQSGGTITLAGDIVAAAGGLTLNAAGAITDTNAVDVHDFVLQNGDWSQVQAALPSFRAANFVLSGGSFLRATSGIGTTVSPFLITDVYGLQGVGTLLTASFQLANDIDASGTAYWNNGAGFVPIGNYGHDGVSEFAGTFDGTGHTINHLTINLPAQDYAGLFGVANGATIENVGLADVNVTGQGSTGGLIGAADTSTVNNTYTTGTVTGTGNYIGGLVGYEGSNAWVEYSYSTATVSGGDEIGGLVGGIDSSRVLYSYATGAVSGGNDIGGLVGRTNLGLIDHAYALGSATGTGSYVGGFVGYSADSNIQYSYAAGYVSGAGSNIGGFAGHAESENSFSYLTADYWDTDTSGTTLGVGTPTDYLLNGSQYPVGLTTAQMHDASNFGYWSDFSTVWYNAGNTLYPILQSEYSTTVTNSHQLELIGMNSTTLAATYTQAADIDLANDPLVGSTAGFAPIGTSALPFTGTYHGDGYTVRNLSIFLSLQNYVGLFGYNTGTIDDVGLVAANVNGQNYVGSLVGYNTGLVQDSYTVSQIAGGGSFVGGLVGYNLGGTVDHSYAVGGEASGSADVGGLVGFNGQFSTVEYSYAVDTVLGGSSRTGGLVGYNNGTVEYSYAAGAVSGTDAGGVVGERGSLGILVGNFFDSDKTGLSFGIGVDDTALDAPSNDNSLGLTTAEMMQPGQLGAMTDTTFAAQWFIAGVDGGGQGQSYPMLQSEAASRIENSHQLALVGMNATTLGGSYTLAQNIEMEADPMFDAVKGFAPIGSATTPFTGDFEGDGHVIANLVIDLPGSSDVGLFGYADNLGVATAVDIRDLSLLSVSVTGGSYVGTLVGFAHGGVFEHVSADGSVTRDGGSGTQLGGLMGANDYGTVADSSANVSVGGVTYVGGLTGENFGTIFLSHADGDVLGDSGTNQIGGLTGVNREGGIIAHSSATGSVTGNQDVGGLAGVNSEGGSIQDSFATGQVAGQQDVGGLVGLNDTSSSIADSSYQAAGENVISGNTNTGGLVGENNGSISRSYATGSLFGSSSAGGLVGANDMGASIQYSYAAVDVDGQNGANIGGLVGLDEGDILYSYETGAVSNAAIFVGGLVGSTVGGSIVDSYASGAVATGGSHVGGVLGYKAGSTTMTSNYFDSTVNPTLSGIADDFDNGDISTNADAAPLTTAQMAVSTNFAGWGFSVGTAGWGDNGYASEVHINSGRPYFQWQYPTDLAVTANDQAVVYGQSANLTPGMGYTVTGGNLTDFAGATVTLDVVGSGVDVGDTNALVPTDTVHSGAVVEFLSGTESFTPVTLTVTLGGTAEKTYDTTTVATLNTGNYTVNGLIGGDGASVTLSAADAAYASADVGAGILVTATGVTLSGAKANDYAVSTTVSGAIGIIDPATLAVTLVGSATKTYDATSTATLTSANYVLSGVLSGDGSLVSVAPGTANYAGVDVATGITVNASGLGLSGAKAMDYTVAPTASGAIGTITPASLTVALSPVDKIYNGTTVAAVTSGDISLTGAFGSDGSSLSVSAGPASYASVDVGAGITVTATGLTLIGTKAEDYVMPTTATGLGSITPRTVTASATGTVTKVYDGTTAAALSNANYVLTGLIGGDSVTATGTGAFDSADAGARAVSAASPTLAGTKAMDYTVSFSGSALTGTITPASLTLTANDATKTTGASLTFGGESGFIASGLVAGQTVTTVNLSSSGAPSGAGAGTYGIDIAGGSGSFNPANYSITYVDGTLTVSGLAPAAPAPPVPSVSPAAAIAALTSTDTTPQQKEDAAKTVVSNAAPQTTGSTTGSSGSSSANPASSSNAVGGSDSSGPSTGDVVSSDDKKGADGNGSGKSSKIQGTAIVATTSSAPPPPNEHVVGAGSVGAIGAVHVNIPPPPSLGAALSHEVRTQLSGALLP